MSSADFQERDAKRRLDAQKSAARERDVRLWWERNPDGPVIPRLLLPLGLRTPEGYVWGHRLAHIFWIQRIPGVNALTIWSRSMLREFGEGYAEHAWDEPLVEPRVRRPWPVLRLPDDAQMGRMPPIGAIDGGCECEHEEEVAYTIRAEETYETDEDATSGNVPAELTNSPVESQEEKAPDVQMADASASGAVAPAQPASESTDSAPPGEQDVQDTDKQAAEPEKANQDGDESAAEEQTGEDDDKTSSEEDEDEGPESDEALDEGPSDEDEQPPKPPQPVLRPFSVKDLPKLEEFIPGHFFPEVLMVHDPDNTTGHRKDIIEEQGERGIKYILHRPTFDDFDDGPIEPTVAHLYLKAANRLGEGHHSFVYRAPLTLPPPLSAHSPTGQVTVAAKLAYNRCSAHNLLRNEAKIYDSFPKHIQKEYCGYNIVPQCRYPVPAVAIVPKFYGYYLPVNDRGDVLDNHHRSCSENHPCVTSWPSPILLMEECGKPVEPAKFTVDQRTECFSLIQRLHHLEIIQGSFYVRNIMVQPGPLTAPPAARSYDTPSYRIIDFGRGETWETWQGKSDRERAAYGPPAGSARATFVAALSEELRRARGELLIDDFGY